MENAERDYQAVLIRMPVDLHRQLKERSAEEERSIAAILRLAARRYLGAKDHSSS